jgi:hypothetical protein
MALVLATEGSDAGEWDTYTNDAFGLVDSHNHTTGQGVKVPTAGLSIDADLAMSSGGNFFALTSAKAVDFQPTAASAMTAYAGALFTNSSDSNNLYFRTQSGTNVRIINGTALDITVAGGIGGDYTAVAAEAAFSDAGKEYTWKQKDPDNFWAAMRSGPLRIAEIDTTDSVYVEVAAPAALAGSYTITLPLAAPASEKPLAMSTSGEIILGHGNREIYIPALSARQNASFTTVSDNGVQAAGATNQLLIPISSLSVGHRIRSVTFYYTRVGGTLTFTLRRNAITGTTNTSIATTTVNTGTAQTSVTLAAIDHTVLTGNQYICFFESGAAGDTVYAVSVTYDMP